MWINKLKLLVFIVLLRKIINCLADINLPEGIVY